MTSVEQKNMDKIKEIVAQYLREYCSEYLFKNKMTAKKVEYVCDFVESAVYDLTGKTSSDYAREVMNRLEI